MWIKAHTCEARCWLCVCLWHDSFTCETWFIYMCDMTLSCGDMTRSRVCQDSFICVAWLIHLCDMTDSSVWHDSCIYVIWLIHICDMTLARDMSDTHANRHTHACDRPGSWWRHNACVMSHMNECHYKIWMLYYAYGWVTTNVDDACNTYEWVTSHMFDRPSSWRRQDAHRRGQGAFDRGVYVCQVF